VDYDFCHIGSNGVGVPAWRQDILGQRGVVEPRHGPIFARFFVYKNSDAQSVQTRPTTDRKQADHDRSSWRQTGEKNAKLAELEGVDRSTVLRELIDIGLDSPQVILLMRRPGAKERGAMGSVIRAVAANEGHAIGAPALAVGRGGVKGPARRGRTSGSDGCV
jgi:hypothetical protein